MLPELAGPLDSLNPEESQTQHQGKRKINHLCLPFSDLRGMDGEHYRQAAADQYRGVDRAQCDIERIAGGGELVFHSSPDAAQGLAGAIFP